MKKTRGLSVLVIMVEIGMLLINFNIVLGASVAHDVYIDTGYTGTYGTGIRIDNATTQKIPLEQNLTIGETYFVKYKVVNNGTAGPEDVNIRVKVSNATGWGKELANYPKEININHYGNITWNTIGLAPGNYNITVNASIPEEGDWSNNERTREVTLVSPPPPVSIASISAPADGYVTAPVMVNNVMNLGAGTVNVTYNSSVVHVTNVTPGTGNALTNVSANINNGTNPGWVIISAWDSTEYGKSGGVIFANIAYKAVGAVNDISPLNISVDNLSDINYNDILYTLTNGTFTISSDETPPIVTNASANPSIILNDNGRARPPGTNITILNVTVYDTGSGVSNVTVNLSAIGGSPVQPMECILETAIWTVTTNATCGINLTHELVVNATDKEGNSNTSVTISLEVLKRGDVVRDNEIDMIDALYIVRYTLHFVPEPSVLVSDVVGAGGNPIGDMKVNMKDALYIMRYINGFELEP